jgi:uncharacterized protein (DUF433 family)
MAEQSVISATRADQALICRDRDICGGAPTIAGTRIGVHDIVSYWRAYGCDLNRVHALFPDLSREQIEAALSFHSDHTDEIDALLLKDRDCYEGLLSRSGDSD